MAVVSSLLTIPQFGFSIRMQNTGPGPHLFAPSHCFRNHRVRRPALTACSGPNCETNFCKSLQLLSFTSPIIVLPAVLTRFVSSHAFANDNGHESPSAPEKFSLGMGAGNSGDVLGVRGSMGPWCSPIGFRKNPHWPHQQHFRRDVKQQQKHRYCSPNRL